MTETISIMGLFFSLVAGACVGFIYFFGLWITLKQLAQHKYPGLLVLTSLIARTAVVILVFYQIVQSMQWQGLFAALLGLVIVRLILSRYIGPDKNGAPANNSALARNDSTSNDASKKAA